MAYAVQLDDEDGIIAFDVLGELGEVSPFAPKSVDVRIERITPEIARRYLQQNTKNRVLKHGSVKAIEGDIRAGRFAFTGASISFATDGRLIDGQHRLEAIALAGSPVDMLVVRGLSPEAQLYIDQNTVRRAGDHLTLRDIPDGTAVCATVNFFIRIMAMHAGTERNINFKISTGEVFATLATHPGLEKHTRLTGSTKGKHVSRGALSALHYIVHQLGHEDEGNAFLRVFSHGECPWPRNAATVLRERLINKSMSNSKPDTISALIHAWNLFVEGREVQLFKVPAAVEIKGLKKWLRENGGL